MRTFIIGLKSKMMRHILYGRSPMSLEEAFSIAQTVYYDHEFLQLDHSNEPRGYQQKSNSTKFNQNKSAKQFGKISESKQENWRQPNPQTNVNKGNSYQGNHQQSQRINQIQSNELEQPSGNLESNQEHQPIPDDLISNSSEASTSSAFLEE